MTTELPKPADRMSEVLGEIVAYCREAGHDWSNLSEAEALLAAGASKPTAQVVTDEQKVVEICERIGFGRVQQIAGDAWEQRHNCTPRGRMGVTVRNENTAAQPEQAKGGEPVASVGEHDSTYRVLNWEVEPDTVPVGSKLYLHPASPVAQQTAQVPDDSALLDWVQRQSLDDFAMGLVVDADHDGKYWCSPDSGGMFYGKTFRDAIKSAMLSAAPSTAANGGEG